jgi:flagellar export protein FliJ
MKAFKFTLQALRTLREQQEQKALQDYGKALTAQERAVSRMDSARRELEESMAHFQVRVVEGGPAQSLSQLQDWNQALERQCQACEHAAKVARNQARLAFARLLSARHATAVINKLYEEQQRRYRREQRRHQQKVLDELASQRHTLSFLTLNNHHAIWN